MENHIATTATAAIDGLEVDAVASLEGNAQMPAQNEKLLYRELLRVAVPFVINHESGALDLNEPTW